MIEFAVAGLAVFLTGLGFYRYGFWKGYSALASEHLGRLTELEESQATLHRVVMEMGKERRS